MRNELLQKTDAAQVTGTTAFKTAANQNFEVLSKIDAIINEMMTVLAPGLPRPKIKINNSQGNTLGLCHWQYGLKEGKPFWWDNTEIEIQKRVTGDERTLRRILAHELAHSEDFLVNEVADLKKYGFHTYKMMRGIHRGDGGHGPKWMAIAQRFNAKYGANFVTKTSDQDTVTDDTNLRPFYVLISADSSGSTLGWQISLRLSPKQKEYLGQCADGKMTYPKRLFMSTDPILMKYGAPMIKYHGSSMPRTDEQKSRLKELWDSGEDILQQFKLKPPRIAKHKTTSKVASPDFNYTKFNDREKDLKKLRIQEPDHGIHLLEAEAIDPIKKSMEKTQGYVTAEKLFLNREELSYAITHSNIKPEWRGTGLGQMLYDRVIAQAKKRGAEYLYSDVTPNNLSKDAVGAWKRLSERYPVEYDDTQRRYRIPLKSQGRKTAAATDGQDVWNSLQQDALSGIVYHGTTVEIANLILKEGFRGLEFDAILQDVLAKYDMTEADIPKKMVKTLGMTRRSYQGEAHLVSTTPGGGVAARWAGGGGEVPRQIEAYLLGKYSTRDVKNSRLNGEPAIIKCRIKNFESTRHYTIMKRTVEGLNRLIADGGANGNFSPRAAAVDTWETYTNFLCKPEDLEVVQVFEGRPQVDALIKQPLRGYVKTAMPDFGYKKYNDREEDLSKITFEVRPGRMIGGDTLVIEAWTPDRRPNPHSQHTLPVGYIELDKENGKDYVFDVSIEDDWRGTGLGQMLYDRAIEEAKKQGADRLWSSTDMQPDAHKAWKRLAQRYPVKKSKGRYYIDFKATKTAINKWDHGIRDTGSPMSLFRVMSRRWDFFTQSQFDPKPASPVGKMGSYQISKANYDEKEPTFAVYDSVNKRNAGFCEMDQQEHYFSIGAIAFDNWYLGLGLPAKLYAWLIKNGHCPTIVSGDKQTDGGRAVWKQLAKLPDIFVYAWNKETGDMFSVDQNDLSAEEPLWDDDNDDTVELLRQEMREGVTRERAMEIAQELVDIEDDKMKYAKNTVLVAVKSEDKTASIQHFASIKTNIASINTSIKTSSVKEAYARGEDESTKWETMMESDKYKDWLPQAYARELSEPWVEYVPISQLLPLREYHWSPKDNRHGEDAFHDSVEDIKRHGIRSPITLRYFKDTNTALVIEGNHRIAQAQMAGLTEVPARVTIATYKRDQYGTDIGGHTGGPVRGMLNPNERIFYDFIPPSAIGLSGKKVKTAAVENERDKKFDELASDQRGEPEKAMLRCQMHPLGAGIGTHALEHCGDITNRMAQHFTYFQGQYGIVKDKVDKCLYWLTNEYGFEREVRENMQNNYRAQVEDNNPKLKGRSYEELAKEFFKLWEAYGNAHSRLTVYNRAQRYAKFAAVALGHRNFSEAIIYLKSLKRILDMGEAEYIKEAGLYVPSGVTKEAGVKDVLKGLGVALLSGALGTALVSKHTTTPPSNPHDKELNQVGHDMIKRLPQTIQSRIGDPNTITFKAGVPSTREGGGDEICQVEQGTRVVYVNPKYIDMFLHTEIADQLTAHETTHIMQSEIDPQGNRFPKTNEADPYGKMKDPNTIVQTLKDLRLKSDRMWNHSREEQAAIVQQYEALVDMLKSAKDPAQKKDIEQKIKVFEPYIADYNQLKVGAKKTIDIPQIRAILKTLREEDGEGQCHTMADILENKFGWEKASGFYLYPTPDKGHNGHGDHSWNVMKDGTIIDGTHDQFGPPDILVVPPGAAIQKKYHAYCGSHECPICTCPECNPGFAEEVNKTASILKGTHVYHGTDSKSAEDIRKRGVDITKCSPGYFGTAFYTALDPDLAKSNYADFSDDEEGGVVLEFEIIGGHILDLKESDDWDEYAALKVRPDANPNFPKMMVQKGVDGLADESFGGVCFYNPRCLKLVGVMKFGSHKQTPMSDTTFPNMDKNDGEGSNAYALQPERVEGNSLMPSLEAMVPGAKLGKEVYHGTPFHFDSFDTDRINTGEGNQTYGWGTVLRGKPRCC